MKNPFLLAGLTALSLGIAGAQETAAKHEIALTIGGLKEERRGPAPLELRGGIALQASYGYRLWAGNKAVLYGEAELSASPLREISASDPSVTRDVATLFITPGIRVKFFPGRAITTYLAAGGGWADYEQSTTTLDGRQNPASRTVNHGVLDYGGGVDVKVWRFITLRAEIRDFYGGGPSYNAPSIHGSQHNVVAGSGIVLGFH